MLEARMCHVCRGSLVELRGCSVGHQVTSDCRPWGEGKLAVCQRCGTVQKPITENWLREADEIYSGYEIYSQGGGAEQSTFDQGTGASCARSQKIVQWLATTDIMPEAGKLLDIGCGNGAFLRAFGTVYPRWQMKGLELDGRNQQVIESIPGVTGLHVGPIESLHDRVDLIVLIHALEHMPNPIQYLQSLTGHLNPGGLLLIEVPNLETSPFDILIADHCTHFTADILLGVMTAAGFEALTLNADCVPKELSVLAQYAALHPSEDRANSGQQAMLLIKESLGKGERVAKAHIAWLQKLLQQGQDVVGTVGIFGTSISATWLAASLGDKVTFFVDEDLNRIGRNHMSCPVYSPAHAPDGSQLLLPLRADIAASIAKRFAQLNLQFILPPA